MLATLALVAFTMQWIDVPALQADTYEQGIIAKGMVFAVIFLSFVVVTGIGGMVSLSQATFVIAGGFAAGWAVNYNWGIDVPLIASHGQLNWFWAVVLGGARRSRHGRRSSRSRCAASARWRWRWARSRSRSPPTW